MPLSTPSGLRSIPLSVLNGRHRLFAVPLANHQRESWEQGHRMRRHRTDDCVAHGGFDQNPKSARLGATVSRIAASLVMPADYIFPLVTWRFKQFDAVSRQQTPLVIVPSTN
jgi:hypothetical protein